MSQIAKTTCYKLGRTGEFHKFSLLTSRAPWASLFNPSKLIRKMTLNVQFPTRNEHKPILSTPDLVTTIQRIFDFQNSRGAINYIRTHRELQKVDTVQLESTFTYLLQKGLPPSYIKKVPWLLLHDFNILDEKSQKVMEELNLNEFSLTVPFFNLTPYQCRRILTMWKAEISNYEITQFRHPDMKSKQFTNRIEILSFWLDSECIKVSEVMARTRIIMSTPLLTLESKILLMNEYGIENEDIIKDPFSFTCVVENLEAKLKKCREHGLISIKPWMLRCTEHVFDAYVKRTHFETELRDGHNDTKSFLSNALECSVSNAQEILYRVPAVRSATATKLNEMIQFLLSHGFTKDHILEVPRVLGHSVETVDIRLRELSSLGFCPNNLHVLCYTTKDYKAFLRKVGGKEDEQTQITQK